MTTEQIKKLEDLGTVYPCTSSLASIQIKIAGLGGNYGERVRYNTNQRGVSWYYLPKIGRWVEDFA